MNVHLDNNNYVAAVVVLAAAIQYNTRCCFNVGSKADMSQLNLPLRSYACYAYSEHRCQSSQSVWYGRRRSSTVRTLTTITLHEIRHKLSRVTQ